MPHPDELERALVVGAGAMGHGIALVYALAGHAVDLVESEPDVLVRAGQRIDASLETLAAVGHIPVDEVPAIRARIALGTDLDGPAARADVVTEAITEDRDAKRALFLRLHARMKTDALLASNTSGLDVFTLMADLPPERLANLVIHHYFLPPTIVPLVEVVAGPVTARATVDRSVALLTRLGRTPVVLARFCENFIVNSFQVALARVAARLLAEGIASPEAIDLAVKSSLGVRLPVVGIAQSLDFTGLDLIARILRNSGEDPAFFERLAADGRLGVKSGAGLYDYGDRSPSEVEATRDRKYLENLQNLRRLGAFDPL